MTGIAVGVAVLGGAVVALQPIVPADAASGEPSSWASICPGRAHAAPTAMVAGGANCRTIVVGGLQRRYVAYVPAAARTKRVPVVFMFHGTSGNGEKFFNISGWKEVAAQRGFIAVFPSSMSYRVLDTGRTTTKWHDFSLRCNLYPRPNTWPAAAAYPADDDAYIDAVLADLQHTTKVDTTRVYASGFSNGAQYAQRLAISRADTFAAIGAWAGQISACVDSAGHQVEPIVPPHLQHPATSEIPTAWGVGNRDPHLLEPYNAARAAKGLPAVSEIPLDTTLLEQFGDQILGTTIAANGLVLDSGKSIAITDWAGVASQPGWPAPKYLTRRWSTPVPGNTSHNTHTFMFLDNNPHFYPNASSSNQQTIAKSGSINAATMFWRFFERYRV